MIIKVKFTLEQDTKAQSGDKNDSTLSLTSAIVVVRGQRHVPAVLPPGKTRYPLYRRLGVHHGWSGRVQKISPPPGFDPQTVQPVASSYTDWAIPAHPGLQLEVCRMEILCIFKKNTQVTKEQVKTFVYVRVTIVSCTSTLWRKWFINYQLSPCLISNLMHKFLFIYI